MRGLLLFGLLLPLLNAAVQGSILPACCQVLIYLMLAQGLNLVVGYAGLLHLGYAAFFAVGAFSMAYLTSPQSPFHLQWSFYLALPVSVAFTLLVGALLAWPTLRLRGDYLAIVTMGFGLMLDPLMRNYDDATKAITGMAAIATPFAGINAMIWYYLLLAGVLVCVGLAYRVRHSSLGRALRALREDSVAAEACGISLARTKLQVLTLGAAVAGLAGALYASYIGTLNLAFPFDFNGSIMVLAMVILGGVGSIRGALVGGLALGVLNLICIPKLIDVVQVHVQPGLARALSDSPALWAKIEPWLDLSKAQFLMFGLTLVIMMLLRPEGIIPEQPVSYE
ncbi:MAG: branched-chain amino acid ABC transporter permease [Candidatus Eremiobacteraeota bacterium]|nr:branched-chain amino acid ABC transporter permease [Candidatus Eremiobacteraeota bacterium]MCW5869003.1 branched-chain amino acid ABC transporter permease [Candidatus Eremiobacteraeota bacterium]